MNGSAKMMSEHDFLVTTGLVMKATDKFEELGWIHPRKEDGIKLYSYTDAEVVVRRQQEWEFRGEKLEESFGPG